LTQVLCVIAFLCASLFGQTVTSTLIGTLIDPAGAVVPNADLKLTDQDSGAIRTGKTNELGLFRFTNLATGNYMISVKAQGFKTYEQKSISVSSSSTRDLGRIELAIGALADTVTVTAEVTPVQVSSSEKSSLVDGDQLNKLAIKGRDLLVLLNTLPGVYINVGAYNAETTSEEGIRQVSINGAPTGKANFLVDGIVDLDSGSYQTTHYLPNMDAVAEVRVLTAGYQAEYGRSSGGTISIITKGGGRAFHGQAFASKRHEMFNAKRWIDNRDNNQKDKYRFLLFGGSVSGPIYIPKVFNKEKNKLFFFFSQEYTRTKANTAVNYYRVPTAAERIGDFSNYRNSAGTMQPIKDPTTQLVVPGNAFSPSLASPMGAAMLNFFPLPNRCDLSNNATGCYNEPDSTQIYNRNFRNTFTGKRVRRNDVLRFDANITSKLTTFFRYINDYDLSQEGGNISLKTASGTVEPYSEDHPNPGHGFGVGITYTISPTMVNEFTFGKSYNTWDWYPHDPSMMDRKLMNNPAHWFDENGPDFKNDGALKRPQMAPGAQNFAFWIPNVGGGSVSSPGSGRPYTNWNDVYSFSDTISWLKGAHTLKVGYYYERTGKVQQAGSGNYLGAYQFGSSSSFPLDAGLGNANMFLGNFQNYGEGKRVMGDWWFTGIEAFVQDSWRVRKGLTVELGVRFYDLQPQENLNNNSAMFLFSSYDKSKAGRYYYRGCKPTGNCTSASNQLAVDPVTGTTAPPVLAGTFVPYSVGGYATQPDFFVGNEVAGVSTKIPRQLFTAPKYMPAVRVGIAWDVFGNGKTAIRASFGQFYQRGDGNQIMNYGGQPPIAFSRTVYYNNITQIPTLAASAAVSPGSNSQLAGKQRYEESMNVNFGFQHNVGFQTVVEASFVGAYRRHTFQNSAIYPNSIPLFSQYNPAYMDPWYTQYTDSSGYTPPKRAYADNYFRPMQGVGGVSIVSFSGSANYNSLQVAARRSMSRGLSIGLAYTFGKGTSIGSPSGYESNAFFKYRNQGPSYMGTGGGPHMLVINYVYETPKLAEKLGFKPLKWVTDDWTVSGITTYSPFTLIGVPGVSLSGGNSTNLQTPVMTGSAEGARLFVMKDPAFSDKQTEYHIFDWNAFQPPMPCSWTAQADPHNGIGQSMACFGNAGSGSLIRVPIKQNNFDLTFAKSFPVFGEGRMLTFRAEMYNIFNHTQINSISTGVNYDFVKWKTGVLAPPNNDTFGRYNGARDPRRMAMTLRFQF
jgi:hypothetical protein